MVALDPEVAILDETDSGLDIEILQKKSKWISAFMNEEKGIVLITHYRLLLDYVKPTFSYATNNGKIIKIVILV